MVRVQNLALFLPRDAMRRARSLLSSGVRQSVCPSRSCIVSRRLKISSNIFLARYPAWF